MKKILFPLLLAISCFLGTGTDAQDINAKLDEADKEYSAKNLDNTRFALQGALQEINMAVGKQILENLPKTMVNLACNTSEDNVSGAGGFAGIVIDRSYGSDPQSVKVDIMGESPLLTSLNAILSMPAIMASSDPNQKRVKVAGYKSLLQKDVSGDATPSYTLQIPMNQTLVSIRYQGITDEQQILRSAETLPFEKIAELSK